MTDQTITVVGAGYVGLVTAVGLVEAGYDVVVVEKAPERYQALRSGQAPIAEPGLQAALERALTSGRLRIDLALPRPLGLVLICVGTPIGDDGRSDLTQLRSALADVQAVADDDTILVLRSTLPVGSADQIRSWSGVPQARTFTNPEFLRQGSALDDFRAPSRVVIGTFSEPDETALARVVALVSTDRVTPIVVDATVSEMIKNGANAFLALKLSFANEIAGLAEEMGVDVGDVLAGISADPRIGSAYLQPSFGFGGSCLPKELQTLAVAGRSVGLPMHVTTAAAQANVASQDRFANRIASVVGGFRGKRIGLLGLAFKSNTDDVRGSPAMRLTRAMMASGAGVRAFDPAAMANALREEPELITVKHAEDVFDDANAVVIATEWPQFATLDWKALAPRPRQRLLVDGRRVVDRTTVEAAGFRVVTLGRGSR
jgi:UDPglucose 6-dehydrogenase